MVRKIKEIKKLAQDLLKEYVVEGAKLITSTLRDKVLENPFEADVLVEQDLQVKATAKAILKDVEGADGALESQALEVAIEEDIPTKAKASAKASDVVETAIICMIYNPILNNILNSSIPQPGTKTPTPHN